MSDEQIADIQTEEQKENGQGEAPAAAIQLDPQIQQQQVTKEVLGSYIEEIWIYEGIKGNSKGMQTFWIKRLLKLDLDSLFFLQVV